MKNLYNFTHHLWGSVVGKERDIRLAVLKDEIELWNERAGEEKQPTYPYGYVSDMLRNRIKELENGELTGK